MKPHEDEALWSYLDGLLRPREHSILTKRLAEEPELRRRLDELSDMHELLKATLPNRRLDDSVARVTAQIEKAIQIEKNKDT